MIDELVKLVQQKVGISEQQARQAVTTVINFLKERLPDPIAGQIDGLLSGKGGGDMLSNLGGMFGKK